MKGNKSQHKTSSERIAELRYTRKITPEMVATLEWVASSQQTFWAAMKHLENITGLRFFDSNDFRRFTKAGPDDVRYVCERYRWGALTVWSCEDCDSYFNDDGNCPLCGPTEEKNEGTMKRREAPFAGP